MKHNSAAQQNVIDARYLRSLIDAVNQLQSKTSSLEQDITGGNMADIVNKVAIIQQEIQAIYDSGRLFGGNIFISDNQPDSPKINDVWLDLNLIRR